jgi:hypothetical protein
MRTLFWLLLLANVILIAVIQQGWQLQDEHLVQAQPALHEEKIRLLAQLNKPDSGSSAPASASRENVPASDLACLEWGEFSGASLKLAKAALSALQLGNDLDKRQVERIIGYWVYIPPLKSGDAVKQKVAELKELNVEEYFIVQDAGPWRNAISLGVFKSKEAAQNYLNVLNTKDVRTARVGERAGKDKVTIFIIRGVDTKAEAKLFAIQRDFPGSELQKIPCAH